jgi:TIR domain
LVPIEPGGGTGEEIVITDRRYARLFDAAFDLSAGVSGRNRKDAARRIANLLLSAVDSADPRGQLREMQATLATEVGQPGSRTLVAEAMKLILPKIRAAKWRLGHQPKIAIITGAETEVEATHLHDALGALGAIVWFYAKSIRVGKRIRAEDERALLEADYVVILVSRGGLKSNFVQYELDIIHWLEMGDRRERLLPVIADNLAFSELPPILAPIKCLSLANSGLGGVVKEIASRIRGDKKMS